MITKIKFVKLAAISAVFLFASQMQGCASYNQNLMNASGQTVRCHTAGFGLLGAIMASSVQNECLQTAQSNGYR